MIIDSEEKIDVIKHSAWPFSKCTLHCKMSSNSLAQKKLSFYSTSWAYTLVKIHKAIFSTWCRKTQDTSHVSSYLFHETIRFYFLYWNCETKKWLSYFFHLWRKTTKKLSTSKFQDWKFLDQKTFNFSLKNSYEIFPIKNSHNIFYTEHMIQRVGFPGKSWKNS